MNILTVPITPEDVKYLDDLLLDKATGRIRLLPASVYKNIDPVHLPVWGVLKARYSFPTVELVDWLRETIRSRRALEIGSGNGDLAYHLGIRPTDNYCQQFPDVELYFRLIGQVPTRPTGDVEKIDALSAIKKYNPEVVVGSYITEQWKGGTSGNMYGPKESDILNFADYIHIGNESTHANKTLITLPHQSFHFDWLFTKSFDASKNVIWIWNKRG
jgi:hypothetical protein